MIQIYWLASMVPPTNHSVPKAPQFLFRLVSHPPTAAHDHPSNPTTMDLDLCLTPLQFWWSRPIHHFHLQLFQLQWLLLVPCAATMINNPSQRPPLTIPSSERIHTPTGRSITISTAGVTHFQAQNYNQIESRLGAEPTTNLESSSMPKATTTRDFENSKRDLGLEVFQQELGKNHEATARTLHHSTY